MKRPLLVAIALTTAGALLTIAIILLSRQGLVNSSHWTTVLGFFITTAIGVGGLVLTYLTLSHQRSTKANANTTGKVTQRNKAGFNLANSGRVGRVSGSNAAPAETGDVVQENTDGVNIANSGTIAEDIEIPKG